VVVMMPSHHMVSKLVNKREGYMVYGCHTCKTWSAHLWCISTWATVLTKVEKVD
jgi:hypothetical protein